jgi:hypothetical protein
MRAESVPVKPKKAAKRIDAVIGSIMGISKIMVHNRREPTYHLSFILK